MLLTLSTTYNPAQDLGFLLMKHPDNLRQLELPFGKASVFFSEATDNQCTVVLMVDVDPIALVRGKGGERTGPLSQYVNDRPYTANSMLAVAMKRMFNTAMAAKSKERPKIVHTPIPLQVHLPVLRSRDGADRIYALFEPLGYHVNAVERPLNHKYAAWGASPYFDVTLDTTAPLHQVLNQIYVLLPVLDGEKHYYVSEDEIDKLLGKSKEWLAEHPEKTWIVRRALKRQRPLVHAALEQLLDRDIPASETTSPHATSTETALETPLRLQEQRMQTVLQQLIQLDARSVLDLGCGEGQLLRLLLKQPQFERILGVDVSMRTLAKAHERLKLDQLPPMQRERIVLQQGSLTYRDKRLEGFDAACVIEVIEHVDPPRLPALERTLFEYARPRAVLVSTPNVEYNIRFESMQPGQMRHPDHRFEWTREAFQTWAYTVAERYRYDVRFVSIGDEDPEIGAPTQMAVFGRVEA